MQNVLCKAIFTVVQRCGLATHAPIDIIIIIITAAQKGEKRKRIRRFLLLPLLALSLSLSGISSGCGYLSTRGRRFHRHDEQHRQQRAHTRGGPGYSRASSSRRLSVGWTPQSATHRSSRHKIQWKKTTFLYPAVCDRHPTCFVNCLSLRARW